MKMFRLSNTLVCALLLSGISLAQGATNIIERAVLSTRIHRTWEGVYKFSEESALRIAGLNDLHVLKYRRSGNKGDLVDFAVANGEGKLSLLLEANTNLKGATPILEGVDVLPDNDGAEIIVRWRHPGNGGFQRVEKYHYTSAGLELTTRSEFMSIDGEKKWISEAALNRKNEEMKKKYLPVREVVQEIENKMK